MKRFLPFLSIAFLMAACNSTPDVKSDAAAAAIQQEVNPDTIGLAKFQEWKSRNEMADVEDYNKPVPVAVAKEAPVRKVQTATRTTRAPQRTAVASRNSSTRSSVPSAPTRSETTADQGAGTSTGTGTGTGEGTTAKAEEKKGISNAAKGAIIGGVGGAVAGAVINKKNRAAGAIIGATVGAGGGYVIGRKMDKKQEGNYY